MIRHWLQPATSILIRQTAAFCCLIIAIVSVGFFAIRFDGVERLVAMTIGYVFLIFACIFSKTSLRDLGLKADTVKKAVRVSFFIGIALLVVLGLVFLISPVIFEDERYRFGVVTAILTIGIYLPLRTVIFEEFLFRGYLLAELSRRTTEKIAVVVSSFLFGLWHIYPSLGVSALRIPVVGEVPQLIVVTAICTATFFAGLLFCFMKLKTDNLLTPILGHWFINAYGIFFAVLAWRQ